MVAVLPAQATAAGVIDLATRSCAARLFAGC